MRLLPAVLLAFATSWTASGQTYTISTFAGGGLPVNIPGTSASLYGPWGIAADKVGNIFFADGYTVLRLDASTKILTLVAGNGTPGYSGDGGSATSAQLSFPSGVALDSVGNLYISGGDRIRKVSNGLITTVAGNGHQGFGGDNGPATSAELCLAGVANLALDAVGNLYIADGCNNRIRRVSNGVITTVAGNGTAGFSGDGGPATSAQLNFPSAVAVDSAGNLYISDNNRIREVSNGVITTIAGNGNQTGSYGGDGGPALSAQLDPIALAVDPAGNVYLADRSNHILEVSNGIINTIPGGAPSTGYSSPYGITLDTDENIYVAYNGFVGVAPGAIVEITAGAATIVAGGPGLGGFNGDNIPATSAQLDRPSDVAIDSAGRVYIADVGQSRILAVSNAVISTVAGNGKSTPPTVNGPALSASLPLAFTGLAVDTVGNLYIADGYSSIVLELSGGILTTVAGNGHQGFSGDGGPAVSAQLSGPNRVAVDSGGNIYIADFGNNRIRKVSNGVITTVAGNGVQGFSGDNGPATSAQLSLIRGGVDSGGGVAVDSASNLYIVDTGNNRIRKVSNGLITTVAGNGTQGFSGDSGLATNAELNIPSAIAVDVAGNLYIGEVGAPRVRRISNGIITTVAGNGAFGFSGDDGPATSAALNGPTGIAVSADGNIYVIDVNNNRIRLLTAGAPGCAFAVSPTSLTAPALGGNLNATIQTTTGCAWTVSGLPSWITVSGSSSGSGNGTVNLVFAPNNSPSQRSATITVAGMLVTVTQPSTVLLITAGGVVNVASYTTPVAPGSLAAVFGNFLLPSPVTATLFPIPSSLGGLSLQFSGAASTPLFYANAGQINAQIPWELSGSTQTTVVASINGQNSAPQSVALATYAPGIFTINGEGLGQGAIVDPNNRVVDPTNPATAGTTVIQIYCTGLGPVSNQPATGAPGPSGPSALTTTQPVVMIGGAQASVQYSGLAPTEVGVYQVNSLVPAGSAKGNSVAVTISIGGVQSNAVTIAVQ